MAATGPGEGRKAQERGRDADSIRVDALTLSTLDRRFDGVIDSGLFHVFGDVDRTGHLAGLSHVIRPGGRPFLLCFSDGELGMPGPRRFTQEEIRQAFDKGWVVEKIRASRYEVRSDLEGISFNEGGLKAWFSTIRREC